MRGLRNRFVRFEVMKSAPQSFSSAIAIAMNNTSLREAQTIMDGASGGATAGVYQIESSDNGVPVPVGVNNLQEEVRPRMGNSANGFNMAQIQCYQCGRFGHLARNCMQRRPIPRGRGRGARRPSFRTRPMGRPMGNQNSANIGRTSANRGRPRGSINAIDNAPQRGVNERIREMQDGLAMMELYENQRQDIYEELSPDQY